MLPRRWDSPAGLPTDAALCASISRQPTPRRLARDAALWLQAPDTDRGCSLPEPSVRLSAEVSLSPQTVSPHTHLELPDSWDALAQSAVAFQRPGGWSVQAGAASGWPSAGGALWQQEQEGGRELQWPAELGSGHRSSQSTVSSMLSEPRKSGSRWHHWRSSSSVTMPSLLVSICCRRRGAASVR